MKDKIKLGYEIKTGKQVDIKPSHLIVTGVTQQSGKTTTLESLINRSGLKAIVFKTKIGEKSFLKGTMIPPYFKDRSDWQFIQGLVEATMKEKLKGWDRAAIIRLSKKTGGKSLLEFKKKVDEELLAPKIRGFERDILTNLQAYLEIVLPKLLTINFSNELELIEGLNIIDLERFSRDIEVQSLIIRSVADEVLNKFKNVILVIPEAWKFLPQGRGNPCKLIVEEFVREGATNNNFIWIDSQDMAGVDKIPLKQVSNWILGYQSEINEVKHTLDQIPLPASIKPKANDIMSLGLGEFYLATREATIKTYIQPFWLDDERAKKVALGKLKVTEIDAPETITPFKIAIKKETQISEQPIIDLQETSKRFNKELSEMTGDFFNKIAEVQEQINKIYTELYNLKNQPKQIIDEDVIIRKVIQKMPVSHVGRVSVNQEAIITEVIARLPKSVGSVYYEVAPLEKIQKDFLAEIKDRIISDVQDTSIDAKKVLKYMESKAVDIVPNEIVTKCLLLKPGGSASVKVSNLLKELVTIEVIQKTPGGRYKAALKDRIQNLMQNHSADQTEIDQLYDHILSSLIGANKNG